MSDVTIVIKAQNQAQAAMQAVKGDLEQIGRTAGGLKQQLANAAAEMRNVGMGLTAGVTLPVVGIAAAAINSAAQFEQSLNVMQQVSGATEAQLASMQAQALQLGAETAFSAGEAAAGMLELAKAGLDTNQVMAAIGGTMDLAAAGNLGLAEAAEIAANAVNTFGLDATETVDIANMLAAAANASSVEVGDLAQGMKMAGSVFAASGQNIDDLTTAMALMGNAGIKGSDAGTSLKTMLMRLTAPTDDAIKVLDQLGVSMYNLDGSTRALPDVLRDLGEATGGMTDETRTMALTTLFGADAIRAVNVLLAEGETGWQTMAEAVGQQGAATEVANARMSGMAGAIEYAKGSLDSFLIGSALPFLDTMGGIVRQAADAITWFGALDPAVKNAALAFTAVLAAAGPVLLALSGIATAIGFLLSPIGLVVVGLAALAAAWTMNFGGIQEITTQAFATIQPYLQAAYDWLMAQIPSALTAFQASWDATWAAIQTATSAAWAAVQGSLDKALTWFQTDAPGALTTLQSTWETTWSELQETASAAWTQLEALFGPALTRLQEAFGKAQTDVGALGPKFTELMTAVQNMWTAVQPVLEAFGAFVAGTLVVVGVLGVNLLAQAFSAMGTVVGAVLDQITLTINTFSAIVGEVVTAVKAVLAGDWATAWQSAQNIVGAFGSYLLGTFANLGLIVGTIFVAIKAAVLNTLSDLGIDGQAILTGIQVWWDGIWLSLAEKVKPVTDGVDAAKAAITSFQEWVGTFTLPDATAGWSFLDLQTWDWPDFPTIPGIVETLTSWQWPGFPELPPIVSMLVKWVWPSFPGMPGWLDALLSWDWPTPPAILQSAGAAVQGATNAVGSAVGNTGAALNNAGAAVSSFFNPNNQLGTSYWPGGPTWVGEAGRELMIPPRGSQIIPNREAERMASVGGITVTIQQMIVRDEQDVHAFAYQVADILARG